MADLVLQAQKRSVFGRKTKTLRREGVLPANIYGKKIKSLAIQVPEKEFEKVFKESGETNIIKLKVAEQSKPRHVLATNLQRDPVTDLPLHIDFHQVDLTEKVTVAIPIETKGESPAVKEKGGILITLLDEVKAEALPKDLPDKFEVDISHMAEIGNSLLIKDLKVDKKKVTLLAAEDETIVTIQEPKVEEEAPPAEAEAPEAPPEGEDEEKPKEEEATAAQPEAKKGGEEKKQVDTKEDKGKK
jgi:large subunit ribosomal protein L25